MTRELSPAEREQRRGAAVKHGASSTGRMRAAAANHRKRLRRQLGIKAGDLDPIAAGFFNHYARLCAKLDAIDAYIAEHGVLKPDGEPQPALSLYVSLANSARLTLSKLDERLRLHGADGHDFGTALAVLDAEAKRVR